MVINYVWIGSEKLDELYLFNMYCWTALNHAVNVYTFNPKGKPFTTKTLGIDEKVVIQVYDLSKVLKNKCNEITMKKTLSILKKWIMEYKKNSDSIDLLYNIVDLTKSYIAGTRKGLVLDMKIGPTLVVGKYEGTLKTKFVSRSIPGKTGRKVENHCMGTMQEKDDLREMYAKHFEGQIKNAVYYEFRPTDKWFDLITGWHGYAWGNTSPNLDLAEAIPEGCTLKDVYVVHCLEKEKERKIGPIRLFKPAWLQSAMSIPQDQLKSVQIKVSNLCQDVAKEFEDSGQTNFKEGDLAECIRAIVEEIKGKAPSLW